MQVLQVRVLVCRSWFGSHARLREGHAGFADWTLLCPIVEPSVRTKDSRSDKPCQGDGGPCAPTSTAPGVLLRGAAGAPRAPRTPASPCRALRSACISSVLSPDAGRMADVPPSDGDQYRSKKMDDRELRHLQRIAAWAGASVLLQALLLGTGAICYHGIDAGVEACRLDKSGRTTGRRSQKV